jgi:hypothetical protein
MQSLYTGLGPARRAGEATLDSLATARRIADTPYNPTVPYPGGGFVTSCATWRS